MPEEMKQRSAKFIILIYREKYWEIIENRMKPLKNTRPQEVKSVLL